MKTSLSHTSFALSVLVITAILPVHPACAADALATAADTGIARQNLVTEYFAAVLAVVLLIICKSLQKKLKQKTDKLQEAESRCEEFKQTLEDENTKLKAALAELEQAQQEARSASVTKGLFLANMSHEIRTPLNAIVGINSLLAEQLPVGELKDLSGDAVIAANNLLEIISDVLDLSRIESGKLAIKPVPFEPRMLVSHLEKTFYNQIKSKGLQFEVSLSHDTPDYLLADPARIQQIAANLLSNAVKFTERGSISLQLGSSVDGENLLVHLVVSDTGKGIKPQYLEQIFKPFEQEDLGTTRKYGGTGLGLAVSRNLAEMMGGSISVQSTPDKGSVFTCTIPCKLYKRQPDLADKQLTTDKAKEFCRGLKILVAEDSPVNSKMLEAILRLDGHHVSFAVNGQQAVDLWQEQPFDLILMDIQMPIMDGVQATTAIRKAEKTGAKRIPIIALTAYALSGDKERFLESGMDAYLAKPITVEQLRTAIARIMHK